MYGGGGRVGIGSGECDGVASLWGVVHSGAAAGLSDDRTVVLLSDPETIEQNHG